MMKEFVIDTLIYIGIAVAYVVGGYVVKYISAKMKQIDNTIANENTSNIIKEAEKAIVSAVSYTSQTFVDALKASNMFDDAKQKEALNKALQKSLEMMSGTTISFIKNTYGDINSWITTKIEEVIKQNKKDK
ncbi:MAG: hypothetical protein E7080_10660 [Bacteroidales bacterium]|nr:hypothetical protein [Bacteroidales bacterium]